MLHPDCVRGSQLAHLYWEAQLLNEPRWKLKASAAVGWSCYPLRLQLIECLGQKTKGMPLWLARRTCIPRSLAFEAHRGPQCFATQGQSDRWRTTHSWMNAVIKTLLFREERGLLHQTSRVFLLTTDWRDGLERTRTLAMDEWEHKDFHLQIWHKQVSRPKAAERDTKPLWHDTSAVGKVETDLFSFQNKDCVITLDCYSNFWEVDYLPDTKSSTVMWKFNFAHEGNPDVFVSQCPSLEFNHFSKAWEFKTPNVIASHLRPKLHKD